MVRKDLLKDKKELLRAKAFELGFDLFGVTDTRSPSSFDHYKSWLNSGKQASMSYLERNTQIRKNPNEILPEAKSIVSLGSYYSSANDDAQGISSYALGKVYHKVLKKKLRALETFCKDY